MHSESFKNPIALKPELAREFATALLIFADLADRQMPKVALRTEYGFCEACRESYEFEHLCLAGRRA